MSTLTQRLDQLESRLQTLIEGRLSRLLPQQASQGELANRLVAAMQAEVLPQFNGTILAPDRFQILVHPSQSHILTENLHLLIELAEVICEAGTESGFCFDAPPEIEVVANDDTNPKEITIKAWISTNTLDETSAIELEETPELTSPPENAFLIVNGRDIFDLDLPVINIGRSKANHLVIVDSRVSRQHAQIRATHGNYSIFDLESTGGTFINQNRISQSSLHPGDVISLAGVSLIYGNETSQALADTHEIQIPPHSQEDHAG